jgi:hypothetical protein
LPGGHSTVPVELGAFAEPKFRANRGELTLVASLMFPVMSAVTFIVAEHVLHIGYEFSSELVPESVIARPSMLAAVVWVAANAACTWGITTALLFVHGLAEQTQRSIPLPPVAVAIGSVPDQTPLA